jgi:hypothetical protein
MNSANPSNQETFPECNRDCMCSSDPPFNSNELHKVLETNVGLITKGSQGIKYST